MARRLIGMAGKVAGLQRGGRRRWSLLLSLIIAVGAAMVVKQTVQAVHDLVFELDGNAVIDSNTDWASLFDANGDPLTLPAGFTGTGFKRDFVLNPDGSFNTSDTSTYATGSKDTLPIAGWQCSRSANVNSKIDIMNTYAAAYTDPATGDQIIYFAQERNNNTGDANVGFWFLQDLVDCSSPGGAVNFSGGHMDGDLLVVSAFTNGGTVSTINVYRWNGDDLTGSLGTTPVASGVDCRDPLLPPGDTACAAADTGAITVPWLTATDKNVGHDLDRAQFFEGGLNLTDAGLSGKCFNTFIGNTRSSQSLTATLFDFASGVIGECLSSTTSTPSITTPTPIPVNATLLVTDSATVTVEGALSFTGQVNFFLCGPNASQTLCTTGGVAAGTKPLTANGTVVSDSMTITSAGWYCWRADFSASAPAGIPPSSDATAGECFQITPLTPILQTQAGAGPVDFGQPVTDTATLAGTAFHQGTGGVGTDGSINPTVPPSAAGGTITFTLFKADCTTQATGTGTNPQVVAISGDGPYGPVGFTPDAPGTYHWVASYSGDTPNTTPSSHNLSCNDPNESVVVQQIPTTIKTKQSWYPNDTATVASTTGNLGAGGKVVFSLYNNATCIGAAFYTEEKTITGGNPSEEVSTANTTVPITTLYTDPVDTAVTYSWKVVYTPAAGDTAHTGKQSACSAERFTITYTNDVGPGTDLP